MTFVSYAQNFEDVLLSRALKDVEEGQYLDIGAQDPVVDSISLAFYHAGWRGIHVEPTPTYASRLREARPDEIVIEAAVSGAVGPIDFYEIENTGISTGQVEIAEHHRKNGFESLHMFVPAVRLDALLALFHGDVHWMKIDVEGMESDVLRSWGDGPARPWILVIEATFPTSQLMTHEQWIDEVLTRDYREVFYDGLSRYFVHRSQDHRAAAFSAPANVFDAFAVAQHHFSASAMRCILEDTEVRHRDELARAIDERRAAENSAAAAIESQESMRAEVAAALANGAALLVRIAEAEQEHADDIENLWRDRRDAEKKLQREHDQKTNKLLETVYRLREDEAVARRTVARLQEQLERVEAILAKMEKRASAAEAAFERTRAELSDEIGKRQTKFEEAQDANRRLRVELARSEAAAEEVRVRLALEVDRQVAALLKAEQVVRAAVGEPPGAWQRLGEILGFRRPSASWRALSAWLAGQAEQARGGAQSPILVPAEQSESSMHSHAFADERHPYLRANSLPELLSWDDVDFVRCAYVTVLGRQPDPEGEAYYTKRIRNGHSKMHVLWRLRRSAEGPKHDPGIAGLDSALKKAAWSEVPLLGAVVRFFTGNEADGITDRRHRSLLNQLAVMRREQFSQSRLLHSLLAQISAPPGVASPRIDKSNIVTQTVPEDHSNGNVSHPADEDAGSRERYILQLMETYA